MNFLWGTLPGKLLMTFLVSMVPIIELRGAIPIATAHGLDWRIAIPIAIIGNLLPVPFIIVFIKKVFAWIRKVLPRLDGFISRLEKRAESKRETVEKYAFWGLFLFVAIPLPGTGAWTGALIAAMMDMRLKRAFPSILLGVITAGIIVSFVSYGAAALFF